MAENTLVHTERLAELIAAVCPIATILVDSEAQTATFTPGAGASQAQIDAGNGVIATFDWSISAHNAWKLVKDRLLARNGLDTDVNREAELNRAILLVIGAEFNRIRQWTRDMKTATAGATNLANFQSRIAALPTLPDLTAQDVIDAVKNRLT